MEELKLKIERMPVDCDLKLINPFGILIPKNEATSVIPGINIVGDYNYFRVSSNLPITTDFAHQIGQLISGIADVKWIDAYSVVYGVSKNPFFIGKELDVMFNVREAIEKMHSAEPEPDVRRVAYNDEIVNLAIQSVESITDILPMEVSESSKIS